MHKSASQLAREHAEASEAHKLAASAESNCKWMHGEHARVHAEAAESMRKIAERWEKKDG